MKTAGIIAEYNPFHHGHQYQLQVLRQKYHIDTIFVMMSGDFVQSGSPAWCHKYLRTQMALDAGADFVFELPVTSVLTSAHYFAAGGVSLLQSLPVDYLCFGCECSDFSLLESLCQLIEHAETDNDYKCTLQDYLRHGLSYPAARQNALQQTQPLWKSVYTDILSQPNNILALEYLQALKHTSIKPLPLFREGDAYHEKEVHSHYTSATAIRRITVTDTTVSPYQALENIKNLVPDTTLKVLESSPFFPITMDDFSDILYTMLRTQQINTMPKDMLERVHTLLPQFTSISAFLNKWKTKNYTYTRLCRSLWQSLFQISPDASSPAYLRLLGMNPKKSNLLRQASYPTITKVADAQRILCSYPKKEQKNNTPYQIERAVSLFQTDILAADLYRQIVNRKFQTNIPDEYHAGVLFPSKYTI